MVVGIGIEPTNCATGISQYMILVSWLVIYIPLDSHYTVSHDPMSQQSLPLAPAIKLVDRAGYAPA